MTYVNAGHNWPVLRHASGAIERLEAGGLPLGINAALPYQSGSGTLGRGDLLLIFTDGLVEAEDDGEHEYGEERMLPVVQTLQSGSAAEALKRIMYRWTRSWDSLASTTILRVWYCGWLRLAR